MKNFFSKGILQHVSIFLLAGTIAVCFNACSKSSSTNNPTSPDNGAGIGPDGGTVTSADGKVSLVIPAGALSTTQEIAIAPDSNGCPQAIGAGYSLTPNGLTFNAPASLTWHYADSIPGSTAAIMGLAYQDNAGDWYGVSGGAVDTTQRTLTVPISHFSVWGTYVPYSITPSSAVVFTGESLAFQVSETGGPASGPAASPVKLNPFATLAAQWSVSGGGTINPSFGSPVTYTAPAQMPSPNLVLLYAKLPVPNQPDYTVGATIHVVAKDWKLSISDSLVWSCPSIITYTYANGGYLDFEVSPTGNHEITAYPWFADPASGVYNEALCPQFAPLVTSYHLNMGHDLKINGLTGYYDEASNTFHISVDESYRSLPGWDVTFKVGDPAHEDIADGNEFTSVLPLLKPMATQSYLDDHSSGAYLEHITTTLTAQP